MANLHPFAMLNQITSDSGTPSVSLAHRDLVLALFGILEEADRALVDPAVTAKLEVLLDEVLGARRRAGEAIDAVCGQAARSIGRLLDGAPSGGVVLPAVASTPGRKARGSGKRKRRTFPASPPASINS